MVNDGFRWGHVFEGHIHMCGSGIPYSARIPEFLQGWAFFEMSEMANLLLVGVRADFSKQKVMLSFNQCLLIRFILQFKIRGKAIPGNGLFPNLMAIILWSS